MKLPYSEGTVFLVPLKNGGFARGVIARAGKRGKVLFGYFFGPRLISPENITIEDLKPEQAVVRLMFGDLGLINGDWKTIGKIANWDRSRWSMPDFATSEPHPNTGKVWLVRYSEDDLPKVVKSTPIDPDENLPTDSLYGYGAVEIHLNKLLK